MQHSLLTAHNDLDEIITELEQGWIAEKNQLD